VGLGLFSWLAYCTHKMPRLLAIVGFLSALFGLTSYALMVGAGASTATPAPLNTAVSFLYLIAVVVWLAWSGISLLRMKPAAMQAQPLAAAIN